MNINDIKDIILENYATFHISDVEMLGSILDPIDVGDEYLLGKDYYAYYYLLLQQLKPTIVGEIGTRLGYSLYTFKKAWPQIQRIYSWDCEEYIGGSQQRAKANVGSLDETTELIFQVQNSQDLPGLGIPEEIDVFQVDGDHSVKGCLHDLELAYNVVKPGGWILVDDVIGSEPEKTSWGDDLRRATLKFFEEKNMPHFYLPTTRGLLVGNKPA